MFIRYLFCLFSLFVIYFVKQNYISMSKLTLNTDTSSAGTLFGDDDILFNNYFPNSSNKENQPQFNNYTKNNNSSNSKHFSLALSPMHNNYTKNNNSSNSKHFSLALSPVHNNITQNNKFDINICNEDNVTIAEAEDEYNKLMRYNDSINETCDLDTDDTLHDERLYKHPKIETRLLKKSNMFEIFKSNVKSGKQMACSSMVNTIYEINNEPAQMETFAQLNNIFPYNIMNVYSSKACKTSQTQNTFGYIFDVDKIDGITLDTFLKNPEHAQTFDDIIKISLQLFYVLLYANMHGHYHNDIKFDNIMITYKSQIQKLKYSQLALKSKSDHNTLKNYGYSVENLNGLLIATLIDFGRSKYIPPNRQQTIKPNPYEAYYLAYLLKSHFEQRYDLTVQTRNNLSQFYSILMSIYNTDAQNNMYEYIDQDIGMRLKTSDDIKNMDIFTTNKRIISVFKKLSSYFKQIAVYKSI